MNFNQLKYIVAVDRHRSFNRAADECEVAQSTLSKEIQRLEKEFGIMIFDRSRFPVTPTMKGADLIHQAGIILEEQRHFTEIARKMNNKPAGNFHLAISPLLAPYLLPLFISSLSKKYPELNLEIEELSSKEILALFEEGDLDGAIILSPFIKDGYYEEPIFKEDFILYISPQHPLYSKAEILWSDIPVNELLLQEEFKNNLLHYDDGENSIALNLNKHGNINYQSGSLETIRKVIDRNGGLTLLPELACLYMGERRLEMVRPITGPKISRTVALVTPRGFEKNRITKVIKKELLNNLPRKKSQE
jgi:LysR family hydrogen peroxide-inducible transcriptional activator